MNTQLSQAIVRIREMILRGELGPGQRVAEAPLADLLGVSRTPVRQALPLLAQEGLLSEHETRGYVVRCLHRRRHRRRYRSARGARRARRYDG